MGEEGSDDSGGGGGRGVGGSVGWCEGVKLMILFLDLCSWSVCWLFEEIN